MDNKEKWNKLTKESHEYPQDLLGVEDRFEKRIMKEARKKKAIISSLTAVVASIIFILLVNFNPSFASAVAELPLLGNLAQYVKFDKSLSKAIESDYVQEVKLLAWDGDKRLYLHYLIADERNLVLFFQLPEDFKQKEDEMAFIRLIKMTNTDTGEKVDGFSYSSGNIPLKNREENHRFIEQNYDFVEGILPKNLEIEVEVRDGNESFGTFKFTLELEDFAEARVYEINEKHTIFGQDIIVEDMKVYPTGTEVNFSFSSENSAIIKGLELLVIQDDMNSFKDGGSGISASYSDTEMRIFIESNYFYTPKKQDLFITGASLIDKNEEFITVDLDNKTIDPKIEGIDLKEVVRVGNNANLVFSTEVSNDNMFMMFGYEYKDEDGNIYELSEEGSRSNNNKMETYITVKYPTSGKVILQRGLSQRMYLDQPIKIELPK